MKDATELNNTMTPRDSASQTKKSRQGKISSSVNRMNHRFNPKNSNISNLENSIINKEEKQGRTKEDFKFVLDSLQSNLESLPSKASVYPARDLTSLTLSAAIAVKHARDTRSRLITSPSIPSSARIGFSINGSKKVYANEEFKTLMQDTVKKVKEFEQFFKLQIIKAQDIELDICIRAFQRIVIHNTLQLSNNLIRYFKTKSIPHFASSDQNDERLLSQIALSNYFEELTSLNNDECIQWILDNDSETSCKSTTMTRLDAKFLRFLCVESKQELLSIFRRYISTNNTDSANKNMCNVDLTS